MSKRIFLFLTVNILIVLTISVLVQALNLGPYLTAAGINYSQLAVFCLIWGFSGSFISLALSRILAKKMMGVQVIPPNTTIPELQGLVEAVHRLSKQAGIDVMPEVGIYESDEVNAFATGPTKNRALVAISTGLAKRMNSNQIYGVLGHEIAHIANGDMVTMTLIQGAVNSFVMFLSRALSFALTQNQREGARMFTRFFMTIFFEIVFGLLGSMLVAWFSRMREYRADAGGAKLAGRSNMIMALEGLLEQSYQNDNFVERTGLSNLKIYGKSSRFVSLFSSHPPLQERISRLKKYNGLN